MHTVKCHDVEQTEKVVPLFKGEIAFRQSIGAYWFLVSTYLICICASKLILSHNQSSATLWVPDTCLIVGLLPLIIIQITASLSSEMESKATK